MRRRMRRVVRYGDGLGETDDRLQMTDYIWRSFQSRMTVNKDFGEPDDAGCPLPQQ
jgi:hypothetical protein